MLIGVISSGEGRSLTLGGGGGGYQAPALCSSFYSPMTRTVARI